MKYIGKETRRVDGVAKVTGAATYAAEFPVRNVAYGFLVLSAAARGTVETIETEAAEAAPGVLKVYTYRNAPKPVRPPRWRALQDEKIAFSNQPIALVVADTYEQARYAAGLVKATYREEKPSTRLEDELKGIQDKPDRQKRRPRGNPQQAYADAPVKIEAEYVIPIEHHNPMEPHGGIAVWEGDRLTFYDKTQSMYGVRDHLAGLFGIPADNVHVISKFVGGAFGSSLRPNEYPWLAAMAARDLKRPVKLVLTRRQMFTGHGYRPYTWQKVAIAASKDGKLAAIIHDHANNASTVEGYSEGWATPSRDIYVCPNVATDSVSVPTNLPHPQAMRAPAMVSHVFAFESAMDELAYALNIDPLELRLINYAEKDPESGMPYSSKELRKCYEVGAKKFGWSKRTMAPRSMRDGRLLVGWGMATGIWGAGQQPTTIKVTLRADGSATLVTATSDIGPGTYTMATVVAAETLGLPPEKVKFDLGDSKFPRGPVQGGSTVTASVGSAILGAAKKIAKRLAALAGPDFAQVADGDLEMVDGKLRMKNAPGKSAAISEILRRNNLPEIEETHTESPSAERNKYKISSHGAQFVEVKVDPDLGTVRVTRVVETTATGRIINPLTSHSQEIGGVVWGIGMALHEATEVDHRYGRMMNPNLAGYHVPVNADVHEIETLFIEEEDKIVNELGIKGMGELGMVGIPAAIANAVFHATGKRVRELPITPDKLL
ncbi:MAG: xanthine dehydrogenase family protein molybdopterin-binding subunit [Fimbriimonas sp.]